MPIHYLRFKHNNKKIDKSVEKEKITQKISFFVDLNWLEDRLCRYQEWIVGNSPDGTGPELEIKQIIATIQPTTQNNLKLLLLGWYNYR